MNIEMVFQMYFEIKLNWFVLKKRVPNNEIPELIQDWKGKCKRKIRKTHSLERRMEGKHEARLGGKGSTE